MKSCVKLKKNHAVALCGNLISLYIKAILSKRASNFILAAKISDAAMIKSQLQLGDLKEAT